VIPGETPSDCDRTAVNGVATPDHEETEMLRARSPKTSTSAIRALSISLAIVASSAAWSAHAQLLSFTARNGQNTAYCGPLGSGLVQHNFATPDASNDTAAMVVPGGPNWSASDASSHLDAILAPFGISLVHSGSASRGPNLGFGVYATADARDNWYFTVASPTRFTMTATLDYAATDGIVSGASYTFGAYSGGAQVIPDPGTPPGAFGNYLSSPGSFAATASGTLTAGQYVMTLQSRVDGNNSAPYAGSYHNSISVGLESGTFTSYCTAGTTTNGCLAVIQGNGLPSASLTSGFTLDVVNMEGATQGLIFYGLSGRTALPWGTSSSFVCVKAPTQRTPVQTASGTPGSCNGAMSVDWNAFISSNPGAVGVPFSAGELVQAQGWFRDSGSPKTTMLSNALEFVVQP
jgi:hypothetical protein